MAELALIELVKRWPDGTVAVDGVSLRVADGERLVLVGPSGCGKSTVLRLVAGLETPTSGTVEIGGVDVGGLEPRERDVAMVFQSYALYPHKSVRENLGFGLRVRGAPRDEIARRVARAAERLGLAQVLERRPAQLSGGQRQRVALGRALVREPAVFLLDEPLSNLDARLRIEMRAELARLHRELATTLLYVTHDQEEALTLGDRVAVMRAGRIEQLGAPREVYERPQTVFVADFVGSPAMNWLEATAESRDGAVRLAGAGFALPAPPGLDTPPGRSLRVGVRPQDWSIVAPDAGSLRAEVEVLQTTGRTRLVHARGPEDLRLVIVDAGDPPLERGDPIGLTTTAERLHLFDPATAHRLPPPVA